MFIPKILISSPTASAKNYCFKEWIENVNNFNYPNFDVVLFDNTDDDGRNTNWLNNTFKDLYGNSNKFTAFHSDILGIESVIERMCISHNDCRRYALNNNYDYLLHLESDVFPNKDVIQNLLFRQKKVIGALYHIDFGKRRRLMVQRRINRTPNDTVYVNMEAWEDTYFIDGKIHKVASVGLGCVLIHRSILQKIPFRFVKDRDNHPDSYFSEDCFRNNIDIWADTSEICIHKNTDWGIYKIDFH